MRLHEFFGEKIPRYAILSHTWGRDEVTFKDLNEPAAVEMRGYRKIRATCEQAFREGLFYAWIDTCCIDKSSSAELSEAINSMFEWYRNAYVCYAYLDDCVKDSFDSIDDFSACRWFQRGWTLQELLASSRVEFYSTHWTHIGNKYTLASVLSEVTGVAERALLWPTSVPSFSIATRMNWASKRVTTRIEDTAYCLLGIFGVKMSPLYGEGMQAFQRLQEELLKISDDESIFAFEPKEQFRKSTLFGEPAKPGALARHPAEFAAQGGVAPVRSKAHRKPYSMTNKGLHIQLPLLNGTDDFEGDSPSVMGVLNCHFEDDFSSFVGIRLEPTATPDIYRRTRDTPVKVPYKTALKAKSRKIYIARDAQASDTFGYSTCWVKSDPVARFGFEISPVLCKSFSTWNARFQISRVHNISSLQPPVCTRLAFHNQITDCAFLATLSHDIARNIAAIRLFSKPDDQSTGEWLASIAEDPTDIYSAEQMLDHSRDTASLIILQPCDDHGVFESLEVTATITPQELLGEEIWVLELDMILEQQCSSSTELPEMLDRALVFPGR